MNTQVQIDVFYGWVELKQDYRDGVWYGWSVTFDQFGQEVSRAKPVPLCQLLYR